MLFNLSLKTTGEKVGQSVKKTGEKVQETISAAASRRKERKKKIYDYDISEEETDPLDEYVDSMDAGEDEKQD